MKALLFLVTAGLMVTVQAAEKVYFLAPKNNATVATTFKAKFAQKGLKVKLAGEDIDNKKAGHYHIIIDGAFIPEGQVIPTDEKHIHFGKGQTEASVTLTPGKHAMTLQFADGAHRSSGEKLSETITVNVK